MAHKFVFDDKRKLITVVAVGTVNMDARLEALRALRADPRFRADSRILCDFLDSRFVPDSADGFALGLMVSGFFRGHKIALVVDASEQMKLNNLIATISTGRVEIHVFTELTAAERWLVSPSAQ